MCTLSRTTSDGGEEEFTSGYFLSKSLIDFIQDTVSQHIKEIFSNVIHAFEKFTQRGSGWRLNKILKFEMFLHDIDLLLHALTSLYQRKRKKEGWLEYQKCRLSR